MSTTLYIAVRVWDADPVVCQLAVVQITESNLHFFQQEQQVLEQSKALKLCFNDERFSYIATDELNEQQTKWQEQILNKLNEEGADYILITEQDYDYALSLPLVEVLDSFTELYDDQDLRGCACIGNIGTVIYTEMINCQQIQEAFLNRRDV
jgi:AMMECR1 domain-containing protein